MRVRTLVDRVLPNIKPADYPRLILGPPGIGKNAIVEEYFSVSHKTIVWNLALIERSDLLGIPKPIQTSQNSKIENLIGFHVNLPNKTIYDGLVSDSPLCIILDEITRVPPEEQGMLFHLITERRLGDLKLDDCLIICLGNPSTYSGTYSLTEALEGRLRKIHLEPDIESWIIWAIQNDIDKRIIRFLAANNEYLHINRKTSPRSWEKVHQSIKGIENNNDELFIEEIQSEIHPEIAARFRVFSNIEVPDSQKIITGAKEFPKDNFELQAIVAADITDIIMHNPNMFQQMVINSIKEEWPQEIVRGLLVPNLNLAGIIANAPNVKKYQREFNTWVEMFCE